jgi:hypothetical protein
VVLLVVKPPGLVGKRRQMKEMPKRGRSPRPRLKNLCDVHEVADQCYSSKAISRYRWTGEKIAIGPTDRTDEEAVV